MARRVALAKERWSEDTRPGEQDTRPQSIDLVYLDATGYEGEQHAFGSVHDLGPDVRAGKSLRTPLHLACSRRHLETSALLLSAHADPQVACGLGRTALHYACAGLTGPRRGGFGDADGCLFELCHLLLRCRPNCRRLRDSSGRTPAELAADGGHLVPELKLLLCDNVAVSTPKAPSARRLSGKRQTKKIMSATG
ncbi:unnamed protein product [Polarella glacialis]|uniref:Uncharacterized protein n=1 Tax=Polarella glacialis TaxID=89957 RepID=A0A813G6E1_POLGL|nr:unnamed protein product [Polarella glacialis]